MCVFVEFQGEDHLRPARHLSYAALFLALSTGSALARCEGAVMLGAVHDAYHATLVNTGDNSLNAARTLLVLVGGKDAATFARQVSRSGVTVPVERLSEALQDAQDLAEATLRGQRIESTGFRHSLHIDWLADTFIASNCQNSRATISRDAVEPVMASETFTRPASASKSSRIKDLVYLALGLFAALTVGLGINRFYHSLYMRRRRVERLPRTPVDMVMEVTITNENGEIVQKEVKVMDISAGGMKLAWEGAPAAGTTATFPLLSSNRLAQIAWSNNFYAGVMFDTMLNKKELATLISEHPA